jgi:hypothetical protein
MGYVVALLWVCGLTAAGLSLYLVWLLTHPPVNDAAEIDNNELHRMCRALNTSRPYAPGLVKR